MSQVAGQGVPVKPKQFAAGGNYPAGGNPWNGQPLRVQPAQDYETPGAAPTAQGVNYKWGVTSDSALSVWQFLATAPVHNWGPAVPPCQVLPPVTATGASLGGAWSTAGTFTSVAASFLTTTNLQAGDVVCVTLSSVLTVSDAGGGLFTASVKLQDQQNGGSLTDIPGTVGIGGGIFAAGTDVTILNEPITVIGWRTITVAGTYSVSLFGSTDDASTSGQLNEYSASIVVYRQNAGDNYTAACWQDVGQYGGAGNYLVAQRNDAGGANTIFFTVSQSGSDLTPTGITRVGTTGVSAMVAVPGANQAVTADFASAGVVSVRLADFGASTWTQHLSASGVSSHSVDLRYFNSLFVLLGGSVFSTSPDGVTWTNHAWVNSGEFQSAATPTMYVAVSCVAGSGTYYTSTTGTSMSTQAQGVVTGTDTITSVAAGPGAGNLAGGSFLFGVYNSVTLKTRFYYSANGTSWTAMSSIAGAYVTNLQSFGCMWIATAENQSTHIINVYFSVDDGTTWYPVMKSGVYALASGNADYQRTKIWTDPCGMLLIGNTGLSLSMRTGLPTPAAA